MTLRVYRGLSSAVVPFAPALIRQRLRLGKEDPERIAECLAEKLLTYGLGRGLGFSDRERVKAIVAQIRQNNYGFRSLIQEVAASEVFARP